MHHISLCSYPSCLPTCVTLNQVIESNPPPLSQKVWVGVRVEASVELEVAIISKRLVKEQVSLLAGLLRVGWWSWADRVEDREAQSGGVHEEEGENKDFYALFYCRHLQERQDL